MADSMSHLQLADNLAASDSGENQAKTAIRAIQQLFDDRNSLRQQLAVAQNDVYALRAAIGDLRRLVAEIHKYYLGTTVQFVAHLKEIETALTNAEARKQHLACDETLVSMARRFSPKRDIGPTPAA